MEYVIDTMKPEDWERCRSIYFEGISTGHSTFEADAPDWEQWDAAHLQEPRLVIKADDQIVAWAALSPVSSRCIYTGVAEVSLYVGAEYRGQGAGSALLAALIDSSEKAGIWTLQGGIFPRTSQASTSLTNTVLERSDGGKRSVRWPTESWLECGEM